jgi:citrate synthase
VRALKNRRVPAGETRRFKSFDNELPILDSAISTITEEGSIYRGVNSAPLSEKATLEQAATLLWDAKSSDPFAKSNLPLISPAMRAVLDATGNALPVARAVSVLALAAEADPRAFSRSAEGRAEIGARIMRLVTASIINREPSGEPLHRQIAQAWAPGNKHAEDIIRRTLVLLADHELNPSTFTVRCAVSTGLNLYDAVITGLVALKGPKHGGAGPLAAHMVAQMAQGDVAAQIRERVALGERIPGFGHGVYKNGDPRAMSLLAVLVRANADKRLAVDAPRLITEATGLHPNIDFALAVAMHTLALPIGHELSLFAMSRTAGWIAHAIEQLDAGGLIRPRARYTGPAPSRSVKRPA